MKLKLNADGSAAVQDGKPVYVDDAGTEIPYDVPAMMVKINELNSEAKTHRLAAKEAKEKLTTFEGIEDPAAAIKALQFAQSMDGKKVMDDEAIQKLIQNAVKPLQEKLNASDTALAEKDGHIYKLEVSNKFQSSPFIKEKSIIPPDMLEATFGKNFKIENGKTIALDASGNQIFSKVKPGEPAGFDEAMQVLFDSHPMKDSLYKASGASGSGAQQNNGNAKTVVTIKRSQFETMDPTAQAAHFKAGGKLED
jgi:hypothetical protein